MENIKERIEKNFKYIESVLENNKKHLNASIDNPKEVYVYKKPKVDLIAQFKATLYGEKKVMEDNFKYIESVINKKNDDCITEVTSELPDLNKNKDIIREGGKFAYHKILTESHESIISSNTREYLKESYGFDIEELKDIDDDSFIENAIIEEAQFYIDRTSLFFERISNFLRDQPLPRVHDRGRNIALPTPEYEVYENKLHGLNFSIIERNHIIVEATCSESRLNEIISILQEFENTTGHPYHVAKNPSILYDIAYRNGGVSVVYLDKELFDELRHTGDINKLKRLHGDILPMIVVAPERIADFSNEYLSRMLKHEDGHIRTNNNLSDFEKDALRLKSALLNDFARRDNIPEEVRQAIYFNLPHEIKALKASKLDAKELIKSNTGKEFPENWNSFELAKIIEIPIDKRFVDFYIQLIGKNTYDQNAYENYCRYVAAIGAVCLSDDGYLSLKKEIQKNMHFKKLVLFESAYASKMKYLESVANDDSKEWLELAAIETDEILLEEDHAVLSEDLYEFNSIENFKEYETPAEMINLEAVKMDDSLDWIEEYLMESPEEKESLPKITDKQESSKNGIRRKKLYIAFIQWAKTYRSKNTFGSVFDQDAFVTLYPFVPHEMRYFYRLANPLLCVLPGKLTFFALNDLKKMNLDNPQANEYLIFAATEKELRVFNMKDKRVYLATIENEKIKTSTMLGETFDIYLQRMINLGDILNGPIDEPKKEESKPEEVTV